MNALAGLEFHGGLHGGSSTTLITQQTENSEDHSHQRCSGEVRHMSQSTRIQTTFQGSRRPQLLTQASGESSSAFLAADHFAPGQDAGGQGGLTSLSSCIPSGLTHEDSSYIRREAFIREQDGGVRLAGGPLDGSSRSVENFINCYPITLPPAYGDL